MAVHPYRHKKWSVVPHRFVKLHCFKIQNTLYYCPSPPRQQPLSKFLGRRKLIHYFVCPFVIAVSSLSTYRLLLGALVSSSTFAIYEWLTMVTADPGWRALATARALAAISQSQKHKGLKRNPHLYLHRDLDHSAFVSLSEDFFLF